MKTILVFGAGKSATALIQNLNQVCLTHNWQLVIADANLLQARSKITDASVAKAIELNITESDKRLSLIKEADIVISLLPPSFHMHVALDCITAEKHLLTASYVDDAMKKLELEIKAKKLLFLCEMGLDPGIDHMSAMQLIDRIKAEGGTITSFKSHCGGLIAPESDNNPWHYKISWNPRNIVLAGSAGATYKENNQIIQKPYDKIFENCEELQLAGLPTMAWYPNRDSLGYIPLYKLEESATFIRTTLRNTDFCKGWDVIVDLKLTDQNDFDVTSKSETFADWFNQKLFAAEGRKLDLKTYMSSYVSKQHQNNILKQFDFLQLNSTDALPAQAKSSADILQYRIEEKLALESTDKDMIVMLHEIEYVLKGQAKKIESCLVVKGEDNTHTAMAKTVGLPLGIAAKLILEEKIKLTGLHIPTLHEIYELILPELAENGITFVEKESLISNH